MTKRIESSPYLEQVALEAIMDDISEPCTLNATPTNSYGPHNDNSHKEITIGIVVVVATTTVLSGATAERMVAALSGTPLASATAQA